jgi:hypothetical protein
MIKNVQKLCRANLLRELVSGAQSVNVSGAPGTTTMLPSG